MSFRLVRDGRVHPMLLVAFILVFAGLAARVHLNLSMGLPLGLPPFTKAVAQVYSGGRP